jgi:hypothetical protein
MLKLTLKFGFILLLSSFVQSNNITRCEFVEELLKVGIRDPNSVEDHTCAAFGSHSYRVLPSKDDNLELSSIYNILRKYWCGKNSKSGGCDILCSKLEDEDVQDDILCADKIMKQQGTSSFHLSGYCSMNIKEEISLCLKNSLSNEIVESSTFKNVIPIYERMMQMMTKCRFVKELKKAEINDLDTIQRHVCAAFKNERLISTRSKNPDTIGVYEIPKEKWCDSNQDQNEIQNQIACFSKLLRVYGTSVIPTKLENCTKLTQEDVDNCSN